MLLRHIFAGAKGLDAQFTSKPREDAWIILYGLGAHDRIQYATRGKVIAFDAGYWDRKLSLTERKYRVSINGFHCPELVARIPSQGPQRWAATELKVAESGGNPDGPIMLVGHGPKSVRAGASGWSAAKAAEIRKTFPGHSVLYRPKPDRPAEQGVGADGLSFGPIENELKRVSFVVCRHSNVAVDACRAGVPVVCEDGAAASIYPNSLGEYGSQPTYAERVEFLERLAWWQWSAAECASGLFWDWLLRAIAAI